MKKFKFIVLFMLFFLVIANNSYALQNVDFITNDDISFYKTDQDCNEFEISDLSITKTSMDQAIALSDSSANIVTVLDAVYNKNAIEHTATDRTNNLADSTFIDLSMDSLTAAKQPFEVGPAANLQFKISNTGNTTAFDTEVYISVDGTSVGVLNVGSILAGYQYTFNFSLTGVPEGSHTISLLAIPGFPIAEPNNTNNSITRSYVWQGIPDLVISTFKTLSEPNARVVGQPVAFEITVSNNGTGSALGTINNHLSANGQEIGVISFENLSAGYTATITFNLTFNQPGTYNLQMHVNKNGTILESNSNNNTKTNSVTIIDARISLPVPEYTQQPHDWLCWATCSAMVISYFENDNINRNIEIAIREHGEDFNHGIGDFLRMEFYVEDYTGIPGSGQSNPLTFAAVKHQINNNGPIITAVFNEGAGHAMVIKGYNIHPEDGELVIYNDPWDWDHGGHAATYSFYLSNPVWDWEDSIFWR
jgi:hypothetical protein